MLIILLVMFNIAAELGLTNAAINGACKLVFNIIDRFDIVRPAESLSISFINNSLKLILPNEFFLP